MLSNKPLSNIINTFLENRAVLYTAGNNLYYSFLSEYSEYNIISTYNQPIIGIINDNPIEYSQKIDQLSIENHVYSIILFHEYPPEALKKEDRYILYQKIKHHYKVFFSNKILNKWSLPKDNYTFVSPYGVEQKDSMASRDKNIILFNFSNNPVLDDIYKNLKSQFSSVDICKSSTTIEDMTRLIRQYKIAVCIGDPYNSLCCAANGCCVLSNSVVDTDISNIFQVEDIMDMSNKINNILENFDPIKEQIKINSSNINKKYSNKEHLETMNIIFKQLSTRPFIYEA